MNDFPAIDLAATGRNIAALRVNRGLSVRQLQTMLGFATPQAIYKWQRGICLPTVDNLVALACIFQVSIDAILVLTWPATAKKPSLQGTPAPKPAIPDPQLQKHPLQGPPTPQPPLQATPIPQPPFQGRAG